MRTPLSIVVLLAAACSGEVPIGNVHSAVRNGVETGLYEKSVFLQVHGGAQCTGSNVRYSRCIVTAGHCILGGAKNKTYYSGTRPLENPTTKKSQPVELGRALSTEPGEDLAIMWLQGLHSSSTQARLAFPDDYEAFPIIRPVNGVLFGRVSQVAPGKHKKNPHKWDLSPEQGFSADFYGYGMSSNDESTAGIKRSGAPFIAGLYPNILRLTPDSGQRIQCFHDSGGPVLFGGLAAVTSAAVDKHGHYTTECSEITDTLSTTFTPTNYEWVDEEMEDLCTQWLNVKIEGQGTVAGNVVPEQSIVIGTKNNSLIECLPGNAGDCIENLHQSGDGRDAQSIDITARPDDGWHFVVWKSQSEKKKCQCHGSGNPTCGVEQAPLGYYSTDESIDEDTCIAVFEKDSTDGGDGGDSGDSSDDGDASDGGVDSD